MGRNSFFRVALVVIVSLVLVFPAAALAGPPQPTRMQTFLRGTQDAAGIAAVGTGASGLLPASLVFTGIMLGAMGLEIAFYSENRTVDTIAASLSLFVRHRNPVIEDMAQRLTQEGIRAVGMEAQRQLSVGSNGARNATTAAPRNSCYVPGVGPVEQSLTMPGNASLGRAAGAGTPSSSPWFKP